MLVNKKFLPNQIVSIKLVSSEEILAKVIEDQETHITVSKPVILMQNPGGGISAIPFVATGDKNDTVNLSKQHVLAITLTAPAFSTQYIKVTSSIQPATADTLSDLRI